jgi:hypothetical protein
MMKKLAEHRNMKIMRTFFHCTVSQKEAIEINRFSDNS